MIVDLKLFSPRWGHDDVYRVEFEREYLEITMHARVARADYRENVDPRWSGEPLERIMRNDNIWPPAHVASLFERLWIEWRGGNVSDDAARDELVALATWINTMTREKPTTPFWRGFF
ncbi:hypothetical protein [Burkholderia cenocepacia]|uniref:hypothetical protein n=1 Tax=Burkholderia cenocepacia TaxID=95486 RepID=UPI0028647CDB|nr:hypothetical protein [Burkholderia cenocepacia]MDR8058736.1 hypothetical protein [Burkholderia cenocepacia]MDR8061176.1 hypothetical protein [Burkholderia cenocepacia]